VGRKGAIVAVVIVAIVAIGLTIALLQLRPEVSEDGGTIIANDTEPTPGEIVSVASARSAFPFVQRWVSQYNNADATGNTELVYYLEEPDTPSDLAIVGDIRHAANGSRSIPVSAQALAVVYNIPSFPDIASGMKLNASVLSSIFNGTVTRWNDPVIKDLNRDLNLPAERIIVVRENGNSSSLTLLENYLSTDTKWPGSSVRVLGPDELAATVRKTPYSIGYVDFSYATQTRMTFAAVANPHGEYVLPSIDSIYQAVNSSMQVQNLTGASQTSLNPPVMNTNMLGNSSYPLTGLYYASLPGNTSNATLAFVEWMVGDGQQTLSEVQYPPIYQDNEPLATYAGTIINSTVPKAAQPSSAES
jgi:ABC-type phosphate transport system substrate-binding protein